MENLPIEKRKKFFLMITIIYLLFTSWQCYRYAQLSVEHGIHLNAYASFGSRLGGYNRQELSDGRGVYLTGTQGDLHWRPRSLQEAALLNTLSGHGIDLLNVFMVLILSGAILYTFKGSREGAVFTKRMPIGFSLVIGSFFITEMACELARLKIADHYLPYITHNRFTAITNYKAMSGELIMPLLLFLAIIPAKGLEQQKEAELTI